MRWSILLLVATGCAFDPRPGDDPDPLDPADPAVTCSVPGTVLCLEFGGEPAVDGSGMQNVTTARNVTVDDASVHGQNAPDARSALLLDPASELRVTATPNLDLTAAFTIEMWVVRNLPVPNGFRYWLVDSSEQYGMSIDDHDALHCGINADAKSLTSEDPVPVGDGTWHHVACTYAAGANNGELRVYIDGAVSDCEDRTNAIVERPGDTTIGARTIGGPNEHFLGSLDNVHVYPAALSDAQICALAGKTGCATECPSDGPDGPIGGGGGFF